MGNKMNANKKSASKEKTVTGDNLFAKLKDFLKVIKLSKCQITNSESSADIIVPDDISPTQQLETIHEAIEALDLLLTAAPTADSTNEDLGSDSHLKVDLTSLKSITTPTYPIVEENSIVEEHLIEEENMHRLVFAVFEEDGGSARISLVPATTTTAVAPIETSETTTKPPKAATFARIKKTFNFNKLSCINPSLKMEGVAALAAPSVLETSADFNAEQLIDGDISVDEVIIKVAPSDAILVDTAPKKKNFVSFKYFLTSASKKVKAPTSSKNSFSIKVAEVIVKPKDRVEAVVKHKKMSSPAFKGLRKKIDLLFKPTQKQAKEEEGL